MSFNKLTYHIVFSPKNREPVISHSIETDFYRMIYTILLQYDAKVHRIGGMPDHIHLLISIPATIALSKFIQAIKRESSKAATSIINHWPGWQEGYAAFSCGYKDLESIKLYIMNQKNHHSKISFIEEYRRWLIENGVSENEPYFPR